ncbi:MAG: hypothetical protein QXU95_03255 [Candidatus Bathyarchaeia archaeon]|nr:hypothetical protein [Candidatus Bathyarchaeota archaeon]
MMRNKKAISMGGILAIVTLIVSVGIGLWIISPALTALTGPAGRVSVTVSDAGRVGANLVRLTILNDGEVRVKIQQITITDTGVSGSAAPGVTISPGASGQVDVSFTTDLPTSALTLKVTIKTDKGEFTAQVNLAAST